MRCKNIGKITVFVNKHYIVIAGELKMVAGNVANNVRWWGIW
jgi:hypothetical protein